MNEEQLEMVTVITKALRQLVQRADSPEFVVNLPYASGQQWQRQIRFRVDWQSVDRERDPILTVEEVENGIAKRAARVQVSEIFDLLPNVRKILEVFAKESDQ